MASWHSCMRRHRAPRAWPTPCAGVPDTPRNLAATAARDIAPPGVAADWTTSNVTLSFVPAWLAEQGYVIEVLDSQNNVLDTIDDSSLWTSCTELAKEPL